MIFVIVPRPAREDCRSGFAVRTGSSDILEEVVLVAMPEACCGQRGTSIATRLSSVTGLACLLIQEAASSDCRGIVRKWVV
jgi:hypothetical protein